MGNLQIRLPGSPVTPELLSSTACQVRGAVAPGRTLVTLGLAVQLPGKLGRLQDSPAWEDVGRKGAGDGVCALGHRGHLPPFPNLAGTDRGDVLAVRVVPITFTQALTSPLGLAAPFWDFSGFGGRETALSTLVWGPVLCWEGAGHRLALCPGCRQELYPASQPPLLFSRSCFQPRVL